MVKLSWPGSNELCTDQGNICLSGLDRKTCGEQTVFASDLAHDKPSQRAGRRLSRYALRRIQASPAQAGASPDIRFASSLYALGVGQLRGGQYRRSSLVGKASQEPKD